MKGPFGRDGFLGEMDRWWLYNKMREEQQQQDDDDLDLYDDDFEYYSESPEFDFSDIDEDLNETRIWYKLLRKDPEYKDIMTEEQWDEICSIGTEESKMMDDALLSDPQAVERWIIEHTDDEATLKQRKEQNEKLIAHYNSQSEAAKKDNNERNTKAGAGQREDISLENADNKTYPRIVVNWDALKIYIIIAVAAFAVIIVFSVLREGARQKYEKKYSLTTTQTTADTTSPTTAATHSAALKTTSQTATETEKTTTYKKSSARKKTTTKKDKYNVYDYKDPEDFYEDNYDDFWDYEDAEDYYREKTR